MTNMWWSGRALILMIYLTTPFIAAFLLIITLSIRRRTGQGGGHILEVLWILLVGVVWTVINLVSIGWIPAGVGGVEGIQPQQSMTIEASMWLFKVDAPRLNPYTATEITAWSTDTMHSVAIYDPDGRLITTIMLMPGMKERLILNLPPGEYIIRCLEYCGDGHAYMAASFKVGL